MNELISIIENSELQQETSATLKEQFLPFFEQAQSWKTKAEQLVVTDVSQTREMKMAREARLALREIRVNADKTRKALKEDSIRYGKAVQGVYNVIEYLIAPIEKHLLDQEKFAEIKEAERLAELGQKRESEIQPFAEFVPFNTNFSTLSEEDYMLLLNGAKLQFQAKIEAEAKAEAERIAREKAEAEERERIKKENERLRVEAEKREKEMQKEREEKEIQLQKEREAARLEKEAAEKALKEEREEKERLENEIKAAQEAERLAQIEAEKEAARKAAAPDKEKLLLFAKTIEALSIPEMATDSAKTVSRIIEKKIIDLVETINKYTEKL